MPHSSLLRLVTPVILAVAGTCLCALALPSSSAAAVDATVTTDAAAQVAAIQLAKDFGLPYDEALTRMKRQDAVVELDRRLQKQVPSYAGSWIDQAHGAIVNVQVANNADDQEVATLISQERLGGYAKIRHVRNSLTTLNTAYSSVVGQLSGELSSTNPRLTVALNVQSNSVEVQLVGDSAMTLSESSWYQSLSKSGVPVSLGRVERAAAGAGCFFPNCDPPLRGGVWISSAASGSGYSYCTGGFNVYSNSDGKPYILTAGHGPCSQPNWYELFSSNNTWHTIGPLHNHIFTNGNGTDVGIVAINNPSGWQEPNNYVVVYANGSGGYPTTYDPTYTITGVGDPSVTNIYLCHTGATSGTNCGIITYATTVVSYDGKTISNMFKVKGVACQGDSGGPAYVGHAAYGIFTAYSLTHNYSVTGANGARQQCTPDYWYVVKIGSISYLNVSLYE